MPNFKIDKQTYDAIGNKPSAFIDKETTLNGVQLSLNTVTANDLYSKYNHKHSAGDDIYMIGRDMVLWLAKAGGGLPAKWAAKAKSAEVNLSAFKVNVSKGNYSIA